MRVGGGGDASFWRPPSDRMRVDLILGECCANNARGIGWLVGWFRYVLFSAEAFLDTKSRYVWLVLGQL